MTIQAYRAVAQVDQHGKFHFTKTNAYSGNNGRAAILNNSDGANVLYLAGNAGNGADPQPDGIIVAAGAQILDPEVRALVAQQPGLPDSCRQLQHHPARQTARQDRQGHQFPWHDDS